MSKKLTALETLERIKNINWFAPKDVKSQLKDFYDFTLIEQELKVLEIIKHFIKSLGLTFIFLDDDKEIVIVDSDEYEQWYMCETQEEYDLLKEVLV